MIETENTHILLIDDDEVDLMSVQREINKFNIPVVLDIARNGLDALTILLGDGTGKPIDMPKFIVLDLMMPKMSGLEFLKRLRTYNQFNSIDVYVLTTSNNQLDIKNAHELNVNGYFIKDTEFDAFIGHCKYLLGVAEQSINEQKITTVKNK